MSSCRSRCRKGPEQVPEEIAVREKLYVPALGIEAEVIRVDGDRIELLAGGKKLRQPRSALRQFQPRRYAGHQKPAPRIRDRVERKAFLPRLVLVGKRVEEAQRCLTAFLMKRCCMVKRIWRLCTAPVRVCCARPSGSSWLHDEEVAVFQAAGAEQGGDNVTLVELRH